MSEGNLVFEGSSVDDIVVYYGGKEYYPAGDGMRLGTQAMYQYDAPFPDKKDNEINHVILFLQPGKYRAAGCIDVLEDQVTKKANLRIIKIFQQKDIEINDSLAKMMMDLVMGLPDDF